MRRRVTFGAPAAAGTAAAAATPTGLPCCSGVFVTDPAGARRAMTDGTAVGAAAGASPGPRLAASLPPLVWKSGSTSHLLAAKFHFHPCMQDMQLSGSPVWLVWSAPSTQTSHDVREGLAAVLLAQGLHLPSRKWLYDIASQALQVPSAAFSVPAGHGGFTACVVTEQPCNQHVSNAHEL